MELVATNTNAAELAREPEVVLIEAQRAAKALNDVIKNKKKPVIFNGEQYLEFEDWQTVGRFYGLTAKVVHTAYVHFGDAEGFEARAVVLNSVGDEISAAEAICMTDEANWRNKPLFQLRSMAQTRACSKALRNVLAWVVVLAGYKPTPAEEIDATPAKDYRLNPPKTISPPKSVGPSEKPIRQRFIEDLESYCEGNQQLCEKTVRQISEYANKEGKVFTFGYNEILALKDDDTFKISDKWISLAYSKLKDLIAAENKNGN